MKQWPNLDDEFALGALHCNRITKILAAYYCILPVGSTMCIVWYEL